MYESDPWHPDYLSAQSVHDPVGILTSIRGQGQMVARWAHRNNELEGIPLVLERLAHIDVGVMLLATELSRREGGGHWGQNDEIGEASA